VTEPRRTFMRNWEIWAAWRSGTRTLASIAQEYDLSISYTRELICRRQHRLFFAQKEVERRYLVQSRADRRGRRLLA